MRIFTVNINLNVDKNGHFEQSGRYSHPASKSDMMKNETFFYNIMN